jgi:hypothetical protein
MVLISIQEWNKPKAAKGEPAKGDGVSYVSKIVKDKLWESLIQHFTLPVFEDQKLTEFMKKKVREWALKKMAAQLNNHKKRLYNTYLKADRKAPEFTGQSENLRDHWDAFLQYKESELGKERRAKNKKNAAKKKCHHKMGLGG